MATKLDEYDIGVISIPKQERPLYLTKNFGRLEKETVYVRRGSSTDVASPDEIVKMGQTDALDNENLPLLHVEFFDTRHLKPLGDSIQIETTNLVLPEREEIPNYGDIHIPIGNNSYQIFHSQGTYKNYYRDFASYLKDRFAYSRVDFQVNNEGNVSAKDVNIEIIVKGSNKSIFFCDIRDISEEPPSIFTPFMSPSLNVKNIDPDIWVDCSQDEWIIKAELGKIQPKASTHTFNGLYVGSENPTEMSLDAKIFADNLPSPKNFNLKIELKPEIKRLSVDELMQLIENAFPQNNNDNNV